MSKVSRSKNCCCIVRVNVGNKLCFHFESFICLCPVFQSQIHGTWTKVTSTNTDLNNSCKFFTGCIYDCSGMNFVCKFCNTFLFFYIKITLVSTVCNYIFSKLSPCKVMENHAFFSGVDYGTIVSFCKFFSKLGFFCQFRKNFENFFVYLFCGIVVCKTCAHWNIAFCNAFCSGWS